MSLLPLLAVLAMIIWIVDRVLLWCELRGWITYRRMPRVRHGFGNAVLGIDALLQPERRQIIELQQASKNYREDDDEAGTKDVDSGGSTRNANRSADAGGPRLARVPPALRCE